MKCRIHSWEDSMKNKKKGERDQQDFGFLDVTLMPYIIGHKRYFIWY